MKSTDILAKVSHNFDKTFPKTSKNAVACRLTDWNELLVTLNDDSVVIYDDYTKTCRLMPKDFSKMTELEFRTEFSKRLKSIMEKLHISQKDLAEKTDINQITISNYTTGKSTPGFYNVYKIASVLHCSVEDFLYLGGGMIK